jgi:hypothetical protein
VAVRTHRDPVTKMECKRRSLASIPDCKRRRSGVKLVRRSLPSVPHLSLHDGEVGDQTIECTDNLLLQGLTVHQSAFCLFPGGDGPGREGSRPRDPSLPEPGAYGDRGI